MLVMTAELVEVSSSGEGIGDGHRREDCRGLGFGLGAALGGEDTVALRVREDCWLGHAAAVGVRFVGSFGVGRRRVDLLDDLQVALGRVGLEQAVLRVGFDHLALGLFLVGEHFD